MSRPRLLTPAQAADYFAVDPKTLVRWVHVGRFPDMFEGRKVVVRTGGGHHRFDQRAMEALQTGALEWAPMEVRS